MCRCKTLSRSAAAHATGLLLPRPRPVRRVGSTPTAAVPTPSRMLRSRSVLHPAPSRVPEAPRWQCACYMSGHTAVHDLSGTIDDGTLAAESDDGSVAIDGSIDDSTGELTGTYRYDTDNGSVTGSAEELGACSINRGSGGQGTFSYAHYVGQGTGAVSFCYDAYSIPDQFTVSTRNGVKYTTGGLVSGSKTVSISIDDEPVVFVNISAPRSSTAWEYTLGCL